MTTTALSLPGAHSRFRLILLYAGSMVERHLDTTNVLFTDGHVKAQKLDALNKKAANGAYVSFSVDDDSPAP